MILYPTETLYAIGVNALDERELLKLYKLKERDERKAVSWLVRSLDDIARYAEIPALAFEIANVFLPGSLTLVLKAQNHVSKAVTADDGTIAFRITTDPIAIDLIAKFTQEHNAPLTCTSANVSGAPTLSTTGEILQQFGPNARLIDTVVDDGPRKGLASTIVRILGTQMTILREGDVSEAQLLALKK